MECWCICFTEEVLCWFLQYSISSARLWIKLLKFNRIPAVYFFTLLDNWLLYYKYTDYFIFASGFDLVAVYQLSRRVDPSHTRKGFLYFVDDLFIVLTARAETGFLISKNKKYTAHKYKTLKSKVTILKWNTFLQSHCLITFEKHSQPG